MERQTSTVLQNIFADLTRGVTSDSALQEIKKYRDQMHAEGNEIEEARAILAMSVHFMVSNNNPMSMDLAQQGLQLVEGTRTDLEVDLHVMLCRVSLANDVNAAIAHIQKAHGMSVELHGKARPNVSLRYGEACAKLN